MQRRLRTSHIQLASSTQIDPLDIGARTTSPDSSTRWVPQGARLWVGWRDGACIGTIEQGRRFTFLGTEGDAECAHDTLLGAQHAHVAHPGRCETGGTAGSSQRLLLLVTAISATAMTLLFLLTASVVL